MNSVVVRLRGGLGNQMFQWATGFAMAQRSGAGLSLDVRAGPAGGKLPHLLRWQVQASALTTWQSLRYSRPALAMARRQRWAGRLLRCHSERGLRFDASLQQRTPPLLLDGYFQSERYFVDVRAALLRQFVPRLALSAKQQALARSIRHGVAVHVRRGDYVSDKRIAATHGICSPAYYTAAAELIARHTGEVMFYVFSDDPKWAQTSLRLPGQAVIVDGDPAAPEMDLHLMSLARHHVCANSSFSWWGAWLASQPQQIVVAPRVWFAAKELDSTDIVPASWKRL